MVESRKMSSHARLASESGSTTLGAGGAAVARVSAARADASESKNARALSLERADPTFVVAGTARTAWELGPAAHPAASAAGGSGGEARPDNRPPAQAGAGAGPP